MLLAVVTHTSQAWVDITHVASVVGAFSASFAVGVNLRNRTKLNEIHVNTNGNLSAATAAIEAGHKREEELRAERDAANTALATAVAKTITKPEAP